MLANFMKKIAEEMEVEDTFETEMPGVYAIPLEDDIRLLISTRQRGFAVSCTFGSCPEKEREGFYTQCMQANLLGKGTNGAILGIDEEAKKMKLSIEVDYSIDYHEFCDMIEDFINSVDFWTEEAQSYISEEN